MDEARLKEIEKNHPEGLSREGDELIAALREAWGRHEIAMGWYKEQFERAARAEAEVERLRVELGEIKLVLESEDAAR